MHEEVPLAEAAPVRKRRSGRVLLGIALLLFVGGLVLAGWLAWRGDLDRMLPQQSDAAEERQPMAGPALLPAPAAAPAMTGETLAAQQTSYAVGNVETRLALLEDRLARLDLQANEASGNAARAEGLLVAFAARRVLAKGGQLGYLEDQLKLRFAGAQPQAVATAVRVRARAGDARRTLQRARRARPFAFRSFGRRRRLVADQARILEPVRGAQRQLALAGAARPGAARAD